MSDRNLTENSASLSNEMTIGDEKHIRKAIRERRRERCQRQQKEAIQQLSTLNDEQLDSIAKEAVHDVYHSIARNIRKQRQAVRRKEQISLLYRLPFAELAKLSDQDLDRV